jgi:hypothetical protein
MLGTVHIKRRIAKAQIILYLPDICGGKGSISAYKAVIASVGLCNRARKIRSAVIGGDNSLSKHIVSEMGIIVKMHASCKENRQP